MRALVTGGAGFIGSHLVDLLIEGGHRPFAVDDLSTGRRENLARSLGSGAQLFQGDVTQPEFIEDAFERTRPEVVFHLAAQIDVRRSVSDPAFDLDVNVGGTVRLLELSRRHGVERFAFASTGGAIYGEGDGRDLPLAENAECRPDAPYGQSKLAAEGYLDLYRRMYGLETVALRLGNVYGPRQDPHGEAGVVAIFCRALFDGRRPKVFGDGRQTRDYVYVGDVAAAFLAAADAGGAGPLNIGTGIETSVLELGAMIAAASGTEFEHEPAPPRLGEVQRISIDSSAAGSALGWRPHTQLAEGLAKTADALRTG